MKWLLILGISFDKTVSDLILSFTSYKMYV